jgi:hypothetical protein
MILVYKAFTKRRLGGESLQRVCFFPRWCLARVLTHLVVSYSSFESRTFTDRDDIDACKIMHHCFNLSWTGGLGRVDYADTMHFRANANERFSKQLLELLREIKIDRV